MKTFITTLLLLFSLKGLSADHLALEESLFNPGIRVAAVINREKWDLLSDITLEYRGNEPLRLSGSLGGYYRLHKNLKAGLFYSLKTGQRHDEDWISNGSDWVWVDSSTRMESMLTGDITPRFMIPFLPGDRWVFSVKNRYSLNLYNRQQSYFLLPGISWFYLEDRKPVLNIFAGYGLYFPINYSDSQIYRHGPWVNILYHFSPRWKLEWRSQYLTTQWTVVTPTSRDLITTRGISTSLGILWVP